jgi:hypothetical protein
MELITTSDVQADAHTTAFAVVILATSAID